MCVSNLCESLSLLPLTPERTAPYSLYPNRRALTKVTFHAAAASFALHRALLIAVGTNGVTLANFMVSASAFVEAFEGVAKAGYVRYWQDQRVYQSSRLPSSGLAESRACLQSA